MKDREDYPPETRGWMSSQNTGTNEPLMDLDERLRRVEQRLLILEPPDGVLSTNPALRNAWEAYRIIEKLST
jgi:hypothetical protein